MTKSKKRGGIRRLDARQRQYLPLNDGHSESSSSISSSPSQPLKSFFRRQGIAQYTAIPDASINHDCADPEPDTGTSCLPNVLIDIPTQPMIPRKDIPLKAYDKPPVEDDVCYRPKTGVHSSGIDYEALDRFAERQSRSGKPRHERGRRLSSAEPLQSYGSFGYPAKHMSHEDVAYRITYFSTAEPSSIHARNISEIPAAGNKLSDMLKKGCFWIDILSPTEEEMHALSKIFGIHPLTAEDITTEEPREKCEMFKDYCFICFRSFDQDQCSVNYLQPLGMYILIFKEGVLTFHFRPMPHPYNVRRRIKQLKDYINVTPDWICYGLLDDITDSFAPLIRAIEFEVDSIDELVLILKESEQSDMLRRIGYCRKRMMGLLRLLVTKGDVVKTLIKRGEIRGVDTVRPTISSEVVVYLGDVQDHIITMLQSLNHYEKISSRSHSNYLAQISIEMTQTNNDINDVLSKLTALGSVLIPMNLVTGLWGMNVQVPGQYQEDLTWFTCIMGSMLTFCIASTLLMRYYNIV